MKLEFFIALRYLRSPKKSRSISFITNIAILGVTIGVAALIVVLSVMNGFEQDLKKALIGANAHLTLSAFSSGGEQKIESSSKIIADIRQLIKTEHISAYSLDQALVSSRDAPRGILLKGISPQMELQGDKIDSLIRRELYKTEILTKKGAKKKLQAEHKKEVKEILQNLKAQPRKMKNGKVEILAGIIVGTALAKNLNLNLNDSLTILSSKQKISPFGQIPQRRKFVVVGFFESGLNAYDEIFTLIDLEEAQKTFRLGNYVRGYSIYLHDLDAVKNAQKKLIKKFPFPYIVTSWIDDNYNLFAVLKLEKLGLGVILFLITLVASFNIISSLVILVNEKGKDIAILKTMGMRNSSIRNVFIIQGFVVGFLGSSAGTALGLLVCWILGSFSVIKIPQGVYVSDKIPILVNGYQVGLILFLSLLACFLVTIFPSRKAAHQNPVEGLRYE